MLSGAVVQIVSFKGNLILSILKNGTLFNTWLLQCDKSVLESETELDDSSEYHEGVFSEFKLI